MDKAQSILDRLRNKARSEGKNFQALLQLFCQEEFLRRLQHSQYSRNFILKGGLFLYCISEFTSRPTMDIDLAMRQLSNTAENIAQIVDEILSINGEEDYIAFEVLKTELIAEQRDYTGTRVKLRARIKNTRTPFHVDIATGDVIIPNPEQRQLPTLLDDFESPEVFTYSLESTIAEKFDAIISLMELSSRMKDYYDIYFISNTFAFDAIKLQKAISGTLKNRRTNCELNTLEKVRNFSKDKGMNLKWKHFSKDILGIDLPFLEVLEKIYAFINPIYTAILKEEEALGIWNLQTNSYDSLRP